MDATDDLSAPDDKTVRFRLKRRFPHLPEALAGPGGNVPVIMPERLAQESPFKPVSEIIGSGPYRFLKDEHVSGARAVFARFAEYRPRDGSKVGFTAGPKVAHFDRIEWLTLDPFSAEAALRKGEIDWWENPSRDLVDRVTGDSNITIVSHFATANGIMTFNQLHPPFNNPAIRRALLGAIDQAEAISTIAGADHDNWHDGIGLFGAGTPFATDVGIEVLNGPRDYAKVKRALSEAGYNGERIVVIAPTDVHELGNLTRIGAEQLRRAGMNVDLQEMDFGSVIRRLDRYSDAAARGVVSTGQRLYVHRTVRRFFSRFLKSYWQRRGYKEGWRGVLLALFSGLYPVLTHIKALDLRERANRHV